MTKNDIKQFKLTNDDEIICEVLHWDDDEGTIIIRGALRIINVEDFSRGARFYAFRPWMVFQDNPEELSTINPGHIIAECTPSAEILKHYASSLLQIKEQLRTKKKKKDVPLEDVVSKMDEMDEEEFEQSIDMMLSEIDTYDSDMPENVIKFKPKYTVH